MRKRGREDVRKEGFAVVKREETKFEAFRFAWIVYWRKCEPISVYRFVKKLTAKRALG